MDKVFGETRTTVATRHALIAPDGHVASSLPGFSGVVPYFIISPAMGAGFVQVLLRFSQGGLGSFAADGLETFLYLQEGSCTVTVGAGETLLSPGGYAYCPAGSEIAFRSDAAVVTCFRKKFQGPGEVPGPVFGNASESVAAPFLGNPRALLKTLLPDDPRFDMAVNIFTYEPGATLPFVETHIMEHGLLMLSGQGVYRLENSYYPVCAGDVIWMAPYCPQWFVAMGDGPASYLYYKDINRHPELS
ncbi:MAG: (S)-ureidoglycine aminohydrolase [Terrimicrobiaceae bacterium]